MTHVFSIPDGADFLPTLADAMLDGSLIDGLSRTSGPLSLAQATVYLPTQRAARRFETILRQKLGGSALLPRIAPLGALEPPVEVLAPGDVQDALSDPLLTPAIGERRRQMLLTEIILDWVRALPGAITGASTGALQHDESQRLLIADTPGTAWGLAGQLGGLIDEMTIEGVPWERLDELGEGNHDTYWGITLTFLKIVRDYWGVRLSELRLMDAAERRARLIDLEVGRLSKTAAAQPVIAAGSTGTSLATRKLLAAIAKAARGAVVLPGLDKDLDDLSFAQIGAGARDGLDMLASHPQAALWRLLAALGTARGDVKLIGQRDAARIARARFMSEALRPAETTESWANLADTGFDSALDHVALIAAPDERSEALAAAIILRETLETPGQTAMLITPDRNLSRRVRAELRRWGIDVEDSAGEPLALRAPGMAAALILHALEAGFRPAALAALMAHPHVTFGKGEAAADHLRRNIETGLLRGGPQHDLLADPAGEIAAIREAMTEQYAHPSRKALREADWSAVGAALDVLREGLAPLRAMPARAPLRDWLEAHRAAHAAIAPPPAADDPVAAEALANLFADLIESAPDRLWMTMRDYAGFFARLLRETAVPGAGDHPRLRILGLLEARLIAADRVILAGLDEGIWPPQTSTDAFLNRPMRAELGLSPPERRIGQTAHDFASAMGAREVFLTRAVRRQREPTVPSRFLQRMEAIAGAATWMKVRERGALWLALAARLESPAPAPAITRPAPVPALELRPMSLSVTRIATLRDNPYAIHAERILRLSPLEPLEDTPDAREHGLVLHAIVAEFAQAHAGELKEASRASLFAIADRHIERLRRDDTFLATQWPRMARSLDFYWRWEKQRRTSLLSLAVETRGEAIIPLADVNFKLSGRADRIETHTDGSLVVVDFKTGKVPSGTEVKRGDNPQLTLQAGILQHGTFENVLPENLAATTASLGAYVKLGGREGGGATDIALGDCVEAHWDLMKTLLAHYRDAGAPFHVAPRGAGVSGDYEHLTRIREWSATGGLGNGDEGSA